MNIKSIYVLPAVLMFFSGALLYSHNTQAAAFTFNASPRTINIGQSTTLRWDADGQNCTSNNFGAPVGEDIGQVVVSPTTSTTYTMRCGGTTQNAAVTVIQGPAITLDITANPTSVVRGNSSVISWSSNATSCTSGQITTGGAPSGSVSVTPSSVTPAGSPYDFYQIDCTGPGGSLNKQILIYITEPQFNASCNVSPTTASINQTVRWNANAWNGTAPYSYEWIGQALTGLFGASVNTSYDTVGDKTGSVTATDSFSSGTATVANSVGSRRCTGPTITSNFVPGLAEDGGTQSDMENSILNYAEGIFYGENYPLFGNETIPADVITNPQNYCVEGKLTQACNPAHFVFGAGACNFGFDIRIHSGNGTRALQAGDFGDTIFSQGERGSGTWDRTRYYAAATASLATGSPRRITQNCSVPVTVSANAATAALSANPISVVQGASSVLTWSSTNAASCIGTNFDTANAVAGTLSVTPAATTQYSISCLGQGGNASATTTVSVTSAVDSTADTPANITTTLGQSVVLSTLVRNTGTVSTGVPFPAMILRSDTLGGPETIEKLFKGPSALGIPNGFPANYAELASGSFTPADVRTYYYRVCADLDDTFTGSVIESNESNNCSGYGTITVNAPPSLFPDLTPLSLNPTTVVARESSLFTALLANPGTVVTPNFSSTIFVCQAADTDCIANSFAKNTLWSKFLALIQIKIAQAATSVKILLSGPAIPAGGSGAQTGSHTFSTPGSYSMRLCADLPNNQVTESNEGNNCGNWQLLVVCPAGNTVGAGGVCVPPPTPSGSINACSVSNTNPLVGQPVTYTATLSGGATPFTWIPSLPSACTPSTSNTISCTFSFPGIYTMRVSAVNTPEVNCPLNASPVTVGCVGPVNGTLSAAATRVQPGTGTTLSYSISGGVNTSCLLSGPNVNQVIPSTACIVAPATGSGISTGNLTTQAIYRLTCDGAELSKVIVNVIPKFGEF